MTHHIPHAVRTALPVALALLALGSAPAQPAPRETVPGNWLYVTVAQGDVARSREVRGTLLLCGPPQGHRHAVRACEELRDADGDIARIPPKNVYCPMVHAPVTASARGQWDGRAVAYTKTFSNACLMGANTGAVFALSEPGEGRHAAKEAQGPRARPALGRPPTRAYGRA
ncbi:serine protease [Streptomyces sp. KM273126]|uniref:SSI family serine proteinase inhibitor n=1 Tax=Streptomyces sp. KM273126 TaxID=2545247 RepID=UPI00103A600D|nr:SSI family serine proteinase inhibitor [Streptomyces sp. KM273126]MBA2809821.1 serine protease [Streptomyces sp. KM273126]